MDAIGDLLGMNRSEPIRPLPPPPPVAPIQPDPGELARKRRAASLRRVGVMDLRIEPSVPDSGMGGGLAITPRDT